MSTTDPATSDQPLLNELVAGLTVTGSETALSVGVVGNAVPDPQPPAHCLHCCLGGQPQTLATGGCAFLAAAARDELAPSALHGDRCDRGFRVAARRTTVGRDGAIVLSIEGPLATGTPAAEGAPLLQHLDFTARMVQRVGQILEENSGFANEVLQNYEQLNIIFDLTQQISQVTDVKVVEKLVLQRIAQVLNSQVVGVIGTANDSRSYAAHAAAGTPAADAAVTPELEQIGAHVRRTRQIHVATVGGRQIIAGPLVRLDNQVDVVWADRGARGAPLNAGDLMLIESMLSYGGHIISNTELHERLRRMSLEVIRAMVAAIDKKDHYTSGHSERGGLLTRLTARALGLPATEQQTMEWAGLLHDIGKIGIPEEILCKPGKLTAEEFEVIKQHPRMGYEILKPIASLGLILDGVLYHHEYPDGSGYPEGLRGEQIPLVARIIHVVDTFDALTSTRSYRRAFSIEKAIEIIRSEMGVRIDAEAGAAFFRALDTYRRDEPEDFAARFRNIEQREEPAHA